MSLYCQVYADTDIAHKDLVQMIAIIAGGVATLWSITAPWCEMNVVRNDAFDSIRRRREDDGFLYYRYILEIEPSPAVDENSYVSRVDDLLVALRQNGARTVAACDFEDGLGKKRGDV